MSPVFSFLQPQTALKSLIRQHQIIRFSFGARDPVPVKPYWPRPACAIAFYPRDREWISGLDRTLPWQKPRSAVIGQPTGLTWRQVGRDYLVYQIELQPGALSRLTGVPADALTDGHVDAEALMPAPFRSLVDSIEDTDIPHQMIALAEHYFLAALARASALTQTDRLAARLMANPQTSLDLLASSASVGGRQLRRLFQERTGTGPKLLARIARFDSVVRQHNADPATDWLELAITAGYSDYQHMARDFRDFTGKSPVGFARLEDDAPERAFGYRET